MTGHTSSILREIYGYTANDEVINYESNNLDSADEILNNSKYLVTLLDLAGSLKFIKTTIYGLFCNGANFSFLVLNAKTGLIGTAKEHLEILLAINMPFLIVINKCDLVNELECMNLIPTLRNLIKNKNLKLIDNLEDVNEYFNEQQENQQQQQYQIPFIKCSCLTGQSITLIYKFMNRYANEIPNAFNLSNTNSTIEPYEYLIEDVFYQNEDACVIGGLLLNGELNKNERILIGPLLNGSFIESKILSIQRYKVNKNCLKQSESGSLEIELNKENNQMIKDKFKIRKGMIIVSKSANLSTIKVGRQFKVKLNVIYLKNSIKKGYQCKIFMDNIKQGVYVERIESKKGELPIDEITRTGEYSVILKFIKHSEVLRIGSHLFLHEGQPSHKSTGVIIDIY